MLLLADLEQRYRGSMLEPLAAELTRIGAAVYRTRRHGLTECWLELLASLPDVDAPQARLNQPVVTFGVPQQAAEPPREELRQLLLQLHPWRKGPFKVFGVDIDAEWRADWKWSRVEKGIGRLDGRKVLDVGCGNGYYMFRMLGAGADLVLGLEPSQLFVAQFMALQKYCPGARLAVLPLRLEEFPVAGMEPGFDVVFSMGVLYHQRCAATHIATLKRCLAPGGQLVLETLVLAQAGERALRPQSTYAKMPNVFCIPTPARLCRLLDEAGFSAVRVVDVTPTTTLEQRATAWMRFESLADYLDPNDSSLSVEGYPAPVRAVVVATR